ncbi:MAG: BamA/TamA family outer membrane protein, partial [Verrucomicrobiota bacterium]
TGPRPATLRRAFLEIVAAMVAMTRRGWKTLIAPGLALAIWPAGATETPTKEPARVKIFGFGFLGNREMVRLLGNFQPDGKMPFVIDRTFVEDAAVVLIARAHDEGYLRAILSGDFTMTDGSRQHLAWTNAMEALLPRDFAARETRFRLQGGVRFYYRSIEFSGITVFSKREASSYFVSGEMLLHLHGNRVFSPAALTSSLAALKEAYARAGYQEAGVNTNQVIWNQSTGAVTVEVAVREGLPTIVRSVTVQARGGDQRQEARRTLNPGKPYSRLWQQELAQKLQAEQQIKGFPDATVEFSPLRRETNATSIQLDLSANVTVGPFVRVGGLITKGNRRTKTSVLKSRIKLEEGGPLNRVEAEKSRQSLARLGVFDSVRLRYEPVDDRTRDVIYDVEEGKPISLSVLAGYGSYELLRGGLEFEDRNLFGRAHDLRLRAVQSFKATKADLFYTVPEVFGENVNVFLQGSGLRREEVSFTREEYGGSMGIQKRIVPIQSDLTLRYVYEFLNALDVGSTSTNQTGVQEAKSASFVIELNRDRLDNPLLPRRGLKLFSKVEIASASLGGNVDYQRLLVGASYHLDLNGGRLLHLGVTQGVSFTLGGTADQLPFNKRFFPGGENSVRGYQEGEASPLDQNGKQLGAETYTQANLEFEQLVSKAWSVVAFFDAVGFAQKRADYPWDERLYSVGGGLCWRSLIGPVRLEYGHNLNPRSHDPAGTLHFSIGLPF